MPHTDDMGEKHQMTDSFEWDEDDENGTNSDIPVGPKGLRDAYDRQREKSVALEKRLVELQTKVRGQELAGKLRATGIPEAAWNLFPKDIEPNDEAVKNWVDTYGPLFGTGSAKTEETVEPAITTPVVPQVDTTQFQQIQQVTQGASNGTTKEDFESMLSNPNLEKEVPYEEFLNALRAQGGKV